MNLTFGFKVETLPAAFQAKIAEYGLAKNGIWLTHAFDPEHACRNTADLIRIMTQERICPTTLVAERVNTRVRGPRKKWTPPVGKTKAQKQAERKERDDQDVSAAGDQA